MKYIIRISGVLVICFVLLIIAINSKKVITSEQKGRAAATAGSLANNGRKITDLEKKVIAEGLNIILDKIDQANGKSIEDAYKTYIDKKNDWLNMQPELSENLINYFDSYFEIRLALFFCMEHKMTITKAIELKNRQDWTIFGETKAAKQELYENEFYKDNQYLLGKKEINKGLSDCITKVVDLAKYMQQNLKAHAEIPPTDLIRLSYKYIYELDKNNTVGIQFINLTRAYEDSVAKKIHGASLTEKDVLVLELKEAYHLNEAAEENNESKRKKDCTAIEDEIERIFNEYPNSIGEQGSYKEAFTFLKRITKLASDIQQSKDEFGWFKNEEQKSSLEWVKNTDNIPYMK